MTTAEQVRVEGDAHPGQIVQPRRRIAWSRSRTKDVVAKMGALGLFLALWEGFVLLLDIRTYLLPPPTAVMSEVVGSFPVLMRHAWVTIGEALAGLVLAGVVGVVLASAMVYSALIRGVLMPALVAFNAVPKVAFAPLLVIWLGLGLEPKIALAFLLAFFPIVVNTTRGMHDVEPELINLARLTKAGNRLVFRKIRLPHALPAMFDGFKIALPLAIIGAIVGEFIAASRGLGYLIVAASLQLNTAMVFAALVVIAAFSMVLYSMLGFTEKRLLRWRPSAR